MTILFLILVILACAILGLIILVQNPKGGGLASNVGGLSNQFMGVKQTTDILEKGTWVFATVIGILCLISTLFIGDSSSSKESLLDKAASGAPVQQAPVNTPQPAAPAK